MTEMPVPHAPVRIALIGAGARSRSIYRPLFSTLAPWVTLTAVCDPVREHADALAGQLGVPAYYDIHALVRDRPLEAALVVTPIESHHAISVYLSSHGIHNLVETAWCSLLTQAREMVAAARVGKVVTRVAENFFRFPIDRFARTVRDSGYLGRIGRIFSYADHTGYHNNSRWIAFTGAHPRWVQCVEHTMAHQPFYSMPQRYHADESLSARFFAFPDLFVADTRSGHVKGHLGRHPRPGYTEWQGERGTLVYRAQGHAWGNAQAELRRCSDEVLAPAQEAREQCWGGGYSDQVTPVVLEMRDRRWVRSYADTPLGRLEYANRIDLQELAPHMDDWYGVAVAGHVVDLALAVRGLAPGEFTDDDALMSMMMEVGAQESALQEGRRIALPLTGETETDARTREHLRAKYGVDPLDVEAMLAISYPRP